jgi:kynurenine formamidase
MAAVFDVRAEGAADADYQLPASRINEWERRHGRVPEGSVVLLRTGWAARWPDTKSYLNQDAAGRMHFPGFSVAAVERLIEHKVSGIGCDTMSVDCGASEQFAVHRLALGAGLYHLENLSDLSELPEKGAFLVVAPIKLEGGSGGPVRVFALLP